MFIVRLFDAFVKLIQWLLTPKPTPLPVIDMVEVDGVWQLIPESKPIGKYV